MDSKTLEKVDNIFKSLVKIKDFKYTYNQLYTYLNKSDFLEKIEEIENRKNITPYTIFINEQLDKGEINNGFQSEKEAKQFRDEIDSWSEDFDMHIEIYDHVREENAQPEDFVIKKFFIGAQMVDDNEDLGI